MNRITITVLLIIISVIVAGCTGKKEETTIKTPEGNIKISGSGEKESWCQVGMQITSSGPQGQGSFTIKGITEYSGKKVCEAEWVSDQGTVTQYFTEDNSYTAMVTKDKSGKVISEVNYSAPSK